MDAVRSIAGPDLVMRDSAYAECVRCYAEGALRVLHPMPTRTERGNADLICPHMNDTQKAQFLALHCARYGYVIKEARKYLHMVKSIESVHVIACMDAVGENTVALYSSFAKETNASLDWEYKLRRGFPRKIYSALCRGWS